MNSRKLEFPSLYDLLCLILKLSIVLLDWGAIKLRWWKIGKKPYHIS